VYSAQVLDHFEHPRNAGVVEAADASAQVENPVCGDVLKLTARLRQGQIAEIRFQAKGCVPAIACGSALTELLQGRSIAEAAVLGRDDLIRQLGALPEASSHAAQLALDALVALLKQLKTPQTNMPT
jgi:NifU-like protein involved in Fe-S cluster formation